MNYICQNHDCIIFQSKAVFDVSMNCPVCKEALKHKDEDPDLTFEEETMVENLAYVIAYPLKRALKEGHPWTKINLLKDCFLNYLKYLGLLAASEFFNSSIKDRSMVTLFHNTIAEPSFGKWNVFIRETLKVLNDHGHDYFCPELNAYYERIEVGKKRKLYNGELMYVDENGDTQLKKQQATGIGMLINFRNRFLGHGLTLDQPTSIQLWEEYYPIFKNLLQQMEFTSKYLMYKHEYNEVYLLQGDKIHIVEKEPKTTTNVWMENELGSTLDVLPFYVVPGELALEKDGLEKILSYESYTGKTIRFFSPEGTEKQSSGRILEKLNLLLLDKQKEEPLLPEQFTLNIFQERLDQENRIIINTLQEEKKVIPGVYVSRAKIESKLRKWVSAYSSIFFISSEAGSGKTNLLIEMQRQYSQMGLSSLLIRAGRMLKPTFQEHLCYILNIKAEIVLNKYKSIAGQPDRPTLILIDGLNEATDPERMWLEIIKIAKIFKKGSVKFVVTHRANSSSDLDCFKLIQEEEDLAANHIEKISTLTFQYMNASSDSNSIGNQLQLYYNKAITSDIVVWNELRRICQ